jgi:hypothetical protein
MLDKVVERVVKILAKNTRLYVAKYPTGLDDKVKDFETSIKAATHRKSSGGRHSRLRWSGEDNFGFRVFQ